MPRLIICLLLICPIIHHGQKSETGNWMIYFGNQKISDRWNFHNEIQYRNYNFAGDLEQLLLRGGIGYDLTENNNNLLVGYGYIHSEPYLNGTDDKIEVKEHRLFQQFITRQKHGRVYLQHRYRIEQRFIEEDFRMRFRYFLALNVPVNKKEMEKHTFYLSAYNEIFIKNLSPMFDRNRIYGAAGYQFNKYIRAELGFMNQLLENSSRNQYQVVLFNNLPFRQKE